ncbi:MAG: transketolase [Paludibacteraceae bacterium]|nr:transketolase [Paludibacteraceae bacterium]MEE1174891.1 transketolase [Paludibacteraceae bacterium]
MNEIKLLNRAADNIRILAASMVEKAKSGHPGGAMGGADFINVLFSEFLVFDPDNATWENRDRFFLDPGHMSPMLYAQLAMIGKLNMDDLKSFRQWGSRTPGHPEVNFELGIENTSGPLGQGHTMAVGAAIAERFMAARFGEWTKHKIYTFISDGGIQEEISQGAGRIAGTLGLSNLIMFFDSNEVQLSTFVNQVSAEDTALKYQAWGWNVITINGNDAAQIRTALKQANEETERPTLIIGKTLMGKGAVGPNGESYENKVSTHGQPLGAAGASIDNTVKNLGGDPQNPFVIFDEVQEMYQKRLTELRAMVAKRHAEQAAWEAANPELATKFHNFYSGNIPKIDYASIQQKANQATRSASGAMLGLFSEQVENMVVSSADLSNSDKTEGFLKNSKPFVKGDFSGGFLHAGVSELAMACIMNGMALHGGIIPVCGTFFVFSDYMKPAFRMSALMRLQVIYVWSHDAFRVGEDGPTHQPIEQEMQVRLMESVKNHKGRNSMLVLRPADVDETTVAWKMALENCDTPTALILSRQNVKNLPRKGNAYQEALGTTKGAYVVKDVDGTPDIILLASGSEVSTLVDADALLAERAGVKARIVSVPSEGLFFSQPQSYIRSVIDYSLPIFALTAGLPLSMQRLAGLNGRIYGLDHFGHSAPYTVLDEKFGFNAENIFNQVMDYLATQK